MKWFGRSWNALICRSADRVDVPVGVRCPVCLEPLAEDDNGFFIVDTRRAGRPPTSDPFEAGLWMMDRATERRPWHLTCLIEAVPVDGIEPREIVHLAVDRLMAVVHLLHRVRASAECSALSADAALTAFSELLTPMLSGTRKHLAVAVAAAAAAASRGRGEPSEGQP